MGSTAATAGNSSGRSFGGGITFGFGSQNGFSMQVNAGSNQGKSTGNEVRYDNTLVTATDTLKIKSGGDLNMRGAQVAGDTVKADHVKNLPVGTLVKTQGTPSRAPGRRILSGRLAQVTLVHRSIRCLSSPSAALGKSAR